MDIAEKRVFDEAAGRTRLAVATGAGLAIVGISGDVVGEFGLALREPVRDLAAAGDGRLLVSTDDDVLLVRVAAGDDVAATASVAETGVGPADAVAVADGAAIAAGSDGVVRRADLEPDDPGEWTALGEAEVRNADGRLLAAADGVYRTGPDAIDRVGLDDARDVAAAGPYAATGEGCYRLGPGWTRELDDPVDLVAAAPGGDRAHAASGERLHGRAGEGWTEVPWPPDAPVAGVAYGEATYAVATDGTVLADAGGSSIRRGSRSSGSLTAGGEASGASRASSGPRSDGVSWRARSIGLPDVRACAVVA